jgi:hypothetical protein
MGFREASFYHLVSWVLLFWGFVLLNVFSFFDVSLYGIAVPSGRCVRYAQ